MPPRDAISPLEKIVLVDPRRIVNQYCCRPVLRNDISVVKDGFLANGYVDSYLLSCRYATAPEMQMFYGRPPYSYSPEKAATVTKAALKQGNSGDHFYCFDGHIRKFASIELIDESVLEPGFRFKSLLMPHMSKEDEIAYSLSRNGSQEYSVPLYFLALLLRCHDYDEAVKHSQTGR